MGQNFSDFSDISQDPSICVIQQSQTATTRSTTRKVLTRTASISETVSLPATRTTFNPNVLIASPWHPDIQKPQIPEKPTPILDLTELF
jgi:hypothetical protein